MTDFIDPEELPFTTAEIFEAARTFLPDDAARRTAEHLASCGPDLIAAREQRRAEWRAAGVANAERMLLYGWAYSNELLPALANLSADTAARVERLRRALARDFSDHAV